MVRTCPLTIPCGFWHMDVQFEVDSTAHGPGCAGSGDGRSDSGRSDGTAGELCCAVLVHAVGNARTPCLATSYGWTVLFGAVGTARALCRVGFGLTVGPVQGSRNCMHSMTCQFGQMGRPNRGGWHCPSTMLCRFRQTDGPSSRWMALLTQCRAGSGVMDGPVGGEWHYPRTMLCGFKHNGWSDSGLMARPAHPVVRVQA